MEHSEPREAQSGPRELRLHVTFFPPNSSIDPGIAETLAFYELYDKARTLRIERKSEELDTEAKDFEKLSSILEKTFAVWQSEAAKEIDRETAKRKMREICPDKETQTKVVEFLLPVLREAHGMTEEDLATREQELAARELELAKNQELLNAAEQAHLTLEVVSKQVYSGEARAIKDAASIAEQAIILLIIAERLHPETTRKVAAHRMYWPVLASRDPAWERSVTQRLESLQLGRNLDCLHTRFRNARGADENYPARQWAKLAVRTVEETRQRLLLFREYREEFWELGTTGTIDLADIPEWVAEACQLRPFSTSTARDWGKVIRDMIRDQVPDFHTAPEWKTQRNTAKQNCRETRGEIQNAILDDIMSALGRIAPPPKVPKLDG